MRLYLAGEYPLYAIESISVPFQCLYSYFYIKMERVKWAQERGVPLFLDSGAFSAMHSGAEINIDAYIDFIKEHGAKFEKVAALDCIGDWKGTEKNLQYMRGKGVNPIPVFPS